MYIYKLMDMKKLLEQSSSLGSETVEEENDISKEIVKVARAVYADAQKEGSEVKGQNPWWRGVDMLTKLQHLGKPNVRSHMEKLADKNILEAKLHGTKKVYRIQVMEEDEIE